MSKPKCFLDMDGVLVNLAQPAFEHHSLAYPYDDPDNYGEGNFNNFIDMTPTKFWTELDSDFWKTLPWMEDGQRILGTLEQAFGPDNIYICSSPTGFARNCPDCLSGKARWLATHLPDYDRRFFFGSRKEFFANGENTVLIDDLERNVDSFNTHGGNAFLLPRVWNRRYMDAHRVLDKLREFLKPYG